MNARYLTVGGRLAGEWLEYGSTFLLEDPLAPSPWALSG
jgi:hypothetical protein